MCNSYNSSAASKAYPFEHDGKADITLASCWVVTDDDEMPPSPGKCCFNITFIVTLGESVCVWWDGTEDWKAGYYYGKIVSYFSTNGVAKVSIDYGPGWNLVQHKLTDIIYATYKKADNDRARKESHDGIAYKNYDTKGRWNFTRSINALQEGKDLKQKIDELQAQLEQHLKVY
jgi:hypothetical protein